MKRPLSYIEQFERDLDDFARITQSTRKSKGKIAFPFPVWMPPEARLEEAFLQEYKYQSELLAQQAMSGVMKSYKRFSSVSASLIHYPGVSIGSTTVEQNTDRDGCVAITLRTPFLMVRRGIPVRGSAWCVISMKRLSQYAHSGGPCPCLECTVGDPSEYSTLVQIWIDGQEIEEVFAEFGKRLRACVNLVWNRQRRAGETSSKKQKKESGYDIR